MILVGGIKLTDFVQNESFEKNNTNSTIGKFGIGLKDTISVLFRYGKEIQIQSRFGTFKPIQTFKQGIDQPIETLHTEYEKKQMPSSWNDYYNSRY